MVSCKSKTGDVPCCIMKPMGPGSDQNICLPVSCSLTAVVFQLLIGTDSDGHRLRSDCPSAEIKCIITLKLMARIIFLSLVFVTISMLRASLPTSCLQLHAACLHQSLLAFMLPTSSLHACLRAAAACWHACHVPADFCRPA